MEEKLKDILDYFENLKNMSPEEYRHEFLHLNGHMSLEVFNRVLEEVDRIDCIDSETLAYHPKEYRISQEDFNDVFHYIDEFTDNDHMVPHGEFYDTRIYFIWKGKHYVWRLLQGQGSYCEIYRSESEYKDYQEHLIILEIDPNLEFFKMID